MRRVIFLFILIQISLFQYGQIIADHTVVEKFDEIPQYYIDEVKRMWLSYAGESHSAGIRNGLSKLETAYPAFAVNITESGTPEAYTTSHLRASRATWGDYSNSSGWIYSYGEEDWFTNSTAIARTKAGLLYTKNTGPTLSALGFGWCYDMVETNISGTADPVYGVRWCGETVAGPQGNLAWGLDAADYSITGNTVCLDTYLNATQEYIDYCKSNNISTKVFFTTGTVDGGFSPVEKGYASHLKNERIRNYVKADPTRILFDYADILCYDSNGEPTTYTWEGHIFPIITPTNLTPTTIGHISDAGAVRLAKAMWWMLARMTGWDGGTTKISDVTTDHLLHCSIEVTNDEIRVKLDDSFMSSTVSLYNLQGSLITTQIAGGNLCTINISHLPPGVFIIVISDSNGSKSYKVIIS